MLAVHGAGGGDGDAMEQRQPLGFTDFVVHRDELHLIAGDLMGRAVGGID